MKDPIKIIQEMQESIDKMMQLNREMKEINNNAKLILEECFPKSKGDIE